MEPKVFRKAVAVGLLAGMVMLTVQASAQPQARRGGAFGDWQVKVSFGEDRQMDAILSFSRNAEGQQTGQWISFMGINDLKDVAVQDGTLTFNWVTRNREGQEATSKFTGTIAEGKLTGILAGARGEMKVEGARAPRTPRAVGQWEMKYKIGERDITSTLVITADKEGVLAGEMKSQRGESVISDVQYERGALSFKRTSKFQDREFVSAFEGTLEGDALKGVMKSERGEISVEGTRIGAAIIGTWNLEIAGEQGSRKQRLTVNPDLSGLYGTLPIKQITLEGDKVSFVMVMEFGEQRFEMNFEGAVADAKMIGELKTTRGSQKITGAKVVRTAGRRPAQQ
ncbi:MAG: hypothetical protein IH624_17560 [Phycisphaerae bacterium]|nr:hypothetical protein [Phycisphaerae bacterium]